MRIGLFPVSAFLTDETFERLMAVTINDPAFVSDLRNYWRRDWRVQLLRLLRTPSVRRMERRTVTVVERLEESLWRKGRFRCPGCGADVTGSVVRRAERFWPREVVLTCGAGHCARYTRPRVGWKDLA